MKVAIFGGSFNPVHLGHIALVVHCIEALDLDKLFVIPAMCSPFKKKKEYAPSEHRLKMLKLAFRTVPKTNVLSLELERQGPSYTIDTLYELFEKKYIGTQDHVFLLLGKDSLDGLKSWKSFDTLLQLVTPVVVERAIDVFAKKVSKKIVFLDMPTFDVSASHIRLRLKEGKYIGHLVPQNVHTYIKKYALYHDSNSRKRQKNP